jgi:outer membrane receptor protein involved in Fe transport
LAPNGLSTGIYNAPKAEIYGFDADLEARVTPQFDLRLGYQYLHGRYTDFPGAVASTVNPAGGYFVGIGNVTGNRTVLSPKHTFSATGGYTVPISNGEVKFTASYYYNSGSYEDPDNLVKSPGYSLVNASVRWRSANDKFTVALWGNNLTNKAVTSFLGIVNLGYGFAGMPGIQAGVTRASYEPPRTYGVTVGAKF